jgi:hypothetical protein
MSRVSLEEFARRPLIYLLEPSRRRKPGLFGYFFCFFFAFFFALGTEITCTSNVATAGLTLSTATNFCQRDLLVRPS